MAGLGSGEIRSTPPTTATPPLSETLDQRAPGDAEQPRRPRL